MRQILAALIITLALASGAGPLLAHHGAATFDTGKEVVLEGTVAEWIWANPHCFLKFEVKDKEGAVRTWVTETSNPPDMINRGWSRRSFKPGEAIKATVEPVKNGGPVGRLLEVNFPDGRKLSTRGGPAPFPTTP